jgi:hypothetical protein
MRYLIAVLAAGALVTTSVPIEKLDEQVAGLLGEGNKISLK